jgi:uncharacterized protein
MIYLDTSFLAPLFREEATSSAVAKFLARLPIGSLAISTWASVEFASLISRDTRMGALTVSQGRNLIAEFDAMAKDALIILIPTASDYKLAQQYVANFSTKLRAPDALHLAVARNNSAEFVLSLDDGMLFAAKKLKIAAKRAVR